MMIEEEKEQEMKNLLGDGNEILPKQEGNQYNVEIWVLPTTAASTTRSSIESHDEMDGAPTLTPAPAPAPTSISKKTIFLVSVFTLCWFYTSSKNAVATQQLVQHYKEQLTIIISSSSSSASNSSSYSKVEVGTNFLPHHHWINYSMMTCLTTLQLFVGLVIAKLLSFLYHTFATAGRPSSFFFASTSSSSSSSSSSLEPKTSRFTSKLIGLLHYSGSIFTNLGFAYGTASIVQIIKLLEPIETLLFSILLHYLFLVKGNNNSTKTCSSRVSSSSNGDPPKLESVKCLAIVIVVYGASLLLTSKEIHKDVNVHTVIFTLFSGFALSCRNVAQKMDSTRNENQVIVSPDSTRMKSYDEDDNTERESYYSNSFDFGSNSFNSDSNDIDENTIKNNSKYSFVGTSSLREAAVCGLEHFISITSFAMIPSIICLAFVEFYGIKGIHGSIVIWLVSSNGDSILQAFVFHGLYNISSISVLGLVSAPSHSLLNVGKRISNVLVAAMLFQVPLGIDGTFGLFIVLLGSCIYVKADTLQKRLQTASFSVNT